MDRLLGTSTGAADIFANTGGVMEAALRSAYEIITGRELPFNGLHVNQLGGLQGVKNCRLRHRHAPEWSFLEGVTMSLRWPMVSATRDR